jgi:hypothetical protein
MPRRRGSWLSTVPWVWGARGGRPGLWRGAISGCGSVVGNISLR